MGQCKGFEQMGLGQQVQDLVLENGPGVGRFCPSAVFVLVGVATVHTVNKTKQKRLCNIGEGRGGWRGGCNV